MPAENPVFNEAATRKSKFRFIPADWRDVRILKYIENRTIPPGLVQKYPELLIMLGAWRRGYPAEFFDNRIIYEEGGRLAGFYSVGPMHSHFIGKEGKEREVVLFINCVSILPEFRGGKLIYEIFDRISDMAKGQNMSVEACLLKETSHALVGNPRVVKSIRRRGFEITHSEQVSEGEDTTLYRTRFQLS